MAINKVVNRGTKSKAGMRNLLEYVLRDEKVKEGYVEITGPYLGNEIDYDQIYMEWLSEKRLWGKESGRMYAHNIISFHPDEKVSPEEVLEIGKQFNDEFFPGHQSVIAVHQDKDHLHCHIVTNSVSYLDGLKLHQTKKDLEDQKQFTNAICEERGLTTPTKGEHFDGTPIARAELISWNKDSYNILSKGEESYVFRCACSVTASLHEAKTKDEFISEMENRGWSVRWEDSLKHITFGDDEGHKVRDTNLCKTFHMDLLKEVLEERFKEERYERHRSH